MFKLFIALLVIGFSMSANAQDRPELIRDRLGGSIQALQQSTVQIIAYTGTAASIANAVGGVGARIVRLVCSTDCHYLEGLTPTATVINGSLLPAGVVEYIEISGGSKLSFIQVSAGGTANVTEMK